MNPPGEIGARPAVEKRHAPRSRCLREAHCVFNGGYSNLSVLVRNISATGAKLVGDQLFCLPEEFELQMANPAGAVVARPVRRVWSQPGSVGVEFLAPQRESPPGAVEPMVGAPR